MCLEKTFLGFFNQNRIAPHCSGSLFCHRVSSLFQVRPQNILFQFIYAYTHVTGRERNYYICLMKLAANLGFGFDHVNSWSF